ncbi:peptidase inhibitor family I36 protein [Streptomyces acidiscabies]|uniref:peptidase inhibitor family I36 protein n=1 Tax=Streptomyces acidiscabies TaxID=42234 RepID=UPI0009533E72|nr:peptidase inhibitor family I36 protein [Streptomyces acidiscabies]
MNIRKRSLAAFAATTVAALALTVAPGEAAPHGAKDGVCDRGEFCLYTGANRTGSVVDRVRYDDDLSDTYTGREGARSWWNRSEYDWYVYDATHCEGGWAGPLRPGTMNNTSPDWVWNIVSMARYGSTSKPCGK